MGKFILLTILAYFIFRWLDRVFRGPKRSQANAQRSGDNRSSGNTQSKSQPHTKSMIKDDVGEYVDFEEIDDKDSDKK